MKKKKKETLMGAAKETIGLGIVSGAGLGAMGAISPLAPHSGTTVQATSAGLGLLNVGRMAKSGMLVADSFIPKKPTKKQKSLMDRIFD